MKNQLLTLVFTYMQAVEEVIELRVGEGVPVTSSRMDSILEAVVQHAAISKGKDKHRAVHR